MTDSFITYGNDYLLLNPFKIGIIGICVAVFILIVLLYNLIFYIYPKLLDNKHSFNSVISASALVNTFNNLVKAPFKQYSKISKDLYSLKYLLLTCFIVINSFFFIFFINSIALESHKYSGLNYQSSVDLLETKEFNAFLLFLKTNLPKKTTIALNDPEDPFFMNVKYKFKLAYYLLPITLSANAYEAEYIIVVNYKKLTKIKITLLASQKPMLIYSSEHFKLLKVADKTYPQNKTGVNK